MPTDLEHRTTTVRAEVMHPSGARMEVSIDVISPHSQTYAEGDDTDLVDRTLMCEKVQQAVHAACEALDTALVRST